MKVQIRITYHDDVDYLIDVRKREVADMPVARSPHSEDGASAGSGGYQVGVCQHGTWSSDVRVRQGVRKSISS